MINLLLNFSVDGIALSAIDLNCCILVVVLQRLNSTTLLNVLYQLLLDVQHYLKW
jgi:hypothetical protein